MNPTENDRSYRSFACPICNLTPPGWIQAHRNGEHTLSAYAEIDRLWRITQTELAAQAARNATAPVNTYTDEQGDTYTTNSELLMTTNDARALTHPNDDLDHCFDCGFDCGTHRPGCPRSYGLGDLGNRNRPTGPRYCANCGRSPCVWTGYRTDTVLQNTAGTCKSSQRPITLQEYEVAARVAQVDALTAEQQRTLIMRLSFLYPAEVAAQIESL